MTGDPLLDQLLKWALNPTGNIGTVFLLIVFIAAILTGRLVTKREHEAVLKERDTLRAKADAALEAYQKRDELERMTQIPARRAHRGEAG